LKNFWTKLYLFPEALKHLFNIVRNVSIRHIASMSSRDISIGCVKQKSARRKLLANRKQGDRWAHFPECLGKQTEDFVHFSSTVALLTMKIKTIDDTRNHLKSPQRLFFDSSLLRL
jgi:hypothetical protein